MAKIFYYCFAGVHSSVVAASIHLGKLPSDRVPSLRELTGMPAFDRKSDNSLGTPYFFGRDEQDNEVYVLGLGGNPRFMLEVIAHFLQSRPGLDTLDWKFFDALSTINFLAKMGGFISQRLKGYALGRWITAAGIRGSYVRLVDLVTTVRSCNRLW